MCKLSLQLLGVEAKSTQEQALAAAELVPAGQGARECRRESRPAGGREAEGREICREGHRKEDFAHNVTHLSVDARDLSAIKGPHPIKPNPNPYPLTHT